MAEEEEKENIVEKVNNAFLDFVGNVFGDSMKDSLKETQDKIKDFSSDAIKKFMEFADDAIEKLNLKENENVVKTRDSVEDFLKQSGLLKEDEEEF